MSFLDPSFAVNVVYGGKDVDPAEEQELIKPMVDDASPFGAAGMFNIHDIIEPQKTRDYITMIHHQKK